MFRLSPIKLWRNISIIMFLLAMVFCLIGTFTIHGVLIIHWNDAGVPNNSSGQWVLWAMLLLAFLSMFTHSSFSKKRPGQKFVKYRDVWRFFNWISINLVHNQHNISDLLFLSINRNCYYWHSSHCLLLYFISCNCLYPKQEKKS